MMKKKDERKNHFLVGKYEQLVGIEELYKLEMKKKRTTLWNKI